MQRTMPDDTSAFDDFDVELKSFIEKGSENLSTIFEDFNSNILIPSSTATELLLRLLLEKAPRTEAGSPTITTTGEISR